MNCAVLRFGALSALLLCLVQCNWTSSSSPSDGDDPLAEAEASLAVDGRCWGQIQRVLPRDSTLPRGTTTTLRVRRVCAAGAPLVDRAVRFSVQDPTGKASLVHDWIVWPKSSTWFTVPLPTSVAAPVGLYKFYAYTIDASAIRGWENGDPGARASAVYSGATYTTFADMPSGVSVRWKPIDHSVGAGQFFAAELSIDNQGPHTLGASGWKLFFNFAREILRDGSGNATETQHLRDQGLQLSSADLAASGDAYALEPLVNFVPIRPGETRTLRVLVKGWAIHKGDSPFGFHVLLPGFSLPVAVHASADLNPDDPLQTTRSAVDVMPVQTSRLRYEENRAVAKQAIGPKDSLLPRPLSFTALGGSYTLAGDVVIRYERGLEREAGYLRAALADVLSGAVTLREGGDDTPAIRLRVDAQLNIPGAIPPSAEGYSMTIGPLGVSIVGGDASGVFYAIQTLRQLMPASQGAAVELPAATIVDAPLFHHRGLSLDVARHFQSVETVKKLLDLLSFYKINKFHFHLTDDEGWRLEIPGIPELTSYGSRRGFDPAERGMLHPSNGSTGGLGSDDGIHAKPSTAAEANGGLQPTYQGFEQATLNFVGIGSGYYTTGEFEDILTYAAERHIDVIPEIDMPTHARAAAKAMEYRYRTYERTDLGKATQYRLVDPLDTSAHVTPQGYKDNFVNPCLGSTYAFLTKVVAEIAARYAAVSVPLPMIHGGGDELPDLRTNVWWQGSPLCKSGIDTRAMTDMDLQRDFLAKWSSIIKATGARVAGWDDAIKAGVPPNGFLPISWNNTWGRGHEDGAYKLANANQPVLLGNATNLYLTQASNKDPDEPGSYWANYVDERTTFELMPFDFFANAKADRFGNVFPPDAWAAKEHLTESGKSHIVGIMASVWSENIKSPQTLEYFVFPKLLGVAERAWNRDTPTTNTMPAAWGQFVNALGQALLPRLDVYRDVHVRGPSLSSSSVNYRIPLPGARIVAGMLDVNVRFPGMAVEYSTDGGASFTLFANPVAVPGPVLVRTRTTTGHFSRVARAVE